LIVPSEASLMICVVIDDPQAAAANPPATTSTRIMTMAIPDFMRPPPSPVLPTAKTVAMGHLISYGQAESQPWGATVSAILAAPRPDRLWPPR
jgi:hypothetical protein